MKKRILVTGGGGYVGGRVAKALFHKGFTVQIIDTVNPSVRYHDFPKEISVIHGDLRNKQLLLSALKDVNLVVHLAANIGAMSYMDAHPADILRDNATIDSVLYPALIESGVTKILYSSSSMVFQHPSHFPYKESDFSTLHLPTNIYGFSKLLGEYFCRAFHEQYGLQYVIMRYHNIYGPGEFSKFIPQSSKFQDIKSGFLHVIPALLEKVLQGQYPVELLNGVEDTRPFTYIDDAVEATILLVEGFLLDTREIVNEDFHIGPRKATRILDLAELIWNLYGDNRLFAYTIKHIKTTTAKQREMDPEKIHDVIGWEPKINLEEGVRLTGAWMKEILQDGTKQ